MKENHSNLYPFPLPPLSLNVVPNFVMSSKTNKGDPWPQMEKQVQVMLNDLTMQIQRYRDTATPTVIAENELLDNITTANEFVEDMRFALDQAMDHPEAFSITTEELQDRAEKIRSWERDVEKAQQTGEKIRAAQRKRTQQTDENEDPSMRENNDFLRQEHEIQANVMQEDEQTLDRLSSGIHRLKDTAVNIDEELTTQTHILDDIDKGITRAQLRLDGALKKVGHLLDKTSDKGKLICIGVLFIVLVLCIFLVVR
ncbi:syntaxin 6 [Angomonas deanei]|nr:syntaxin 6 [Angomonas deanei]EPY39422.1 syntaxin 6 [Angomonas deanei]|eukprot:EPY37577.1 syntaxin 6 [Angomonas deanei]